MVYGGDLWNLSVTASQDETESGGCDDACGDYECSGKMCINRGKILLSVDNFYNISGRCG